jgi:radical SAM protein with 4Fe4S-binding SPASM domain
MNEAKKRFLKVNIEIGNICNLQCSFCPEVVREKKMMSESLFTRVIEQVAPLTQEVTFHLMGDPLVHPKLGEFLDIAHRYQVRVFLVTNGVLLREKQAEWLLHPALRQVSFSLHSFHDNFGDSRDPGPYLERIFQYTEAAFEKRPDLYINYRLWNLESPLGVGSKNQEILARVHDRFTTSPAENSELASPSSERLSPRRDVRVRKNHHLKNRLYMHFDTEFTWPSLDLPVLGTQGTCKGLSTHFGVHADGTVVPCCLDKEAEIPLGNLENQSINEILDSPRAKAIYRGFQQGSLIEDLCQRCQYIERFKKKGPSLRGQKSTGAPPNRNP